MKPRTIIPLVIGLGVGFFAIKMAIDMVQRAKGDQSETRSVVVARSGIPAAIRITEAMLVTKEVPTALVPGGSFDDQKRLVGRVTKATVPAGIPVSQNMLAPPGASPGLQAMIPPGHRAVSVRVNEASAVAGWVKPGDHVDVYSSQRGRGNQAGRSGLILSDIKVGAVGQEMSEVGPDGKTARMTKSVTLFLRPEQVPVLDAAAGSGRIRLALRGHSDANEGESFLSRFLDKMPKMNGGQNPQPVAVAAAPRPKLHVVEVRNGSVSYRVAFDKKGRRVRGPQDFKSDIGPNGLQGMRNH